MRTQAVTLCPPLCLYHSGAQNTCSNNETNSGSRSTQDAAVWGKGHLGWLSLSGCWGNLLWRLDFLRWPLTRWYSPSSSHRPSLHTLHIPSAQRLPFPRPIISVWMTPNCSLILFSFLSYRFSLLLSIRYFHSLTTPQHKTQLNTSSRQKLLLLRCCLK